MGSIDDASGAWGLPYRTSKAALDMAMKCFAIELAPQDVAAAPFHPGWVKTDLGGPDAMITTEESVTGLRKRIAEMTPGVDVKLTDYSGKEIPW